VSLSSIAFGVLSRGKSLRKIFGFSATQRLLYRFHLLKVVPSPTPAREGRFVMPQTLPSQPGPRIVGLPRTVELLRVPIAVTDYAQTLDVIDRQVASREPGYVCVCNVHTVMASAEDPELRGALAESLLNVPDGMPLVWALGALGYRLSDRVYGPELMWRACGRAAVTGSRFYLYGGRDKDALTQLADNLRRHHPGLKIAGGYSPPHRPLLTEERDAVIAEVNDAKPDVVWVGIGVPKQEKWMAQMRPHLEAPVLVGVGAAFDFHAGLVPQAPRWLQDAGLEWAYRLLQEPRRLWGRYARYNPRFVAAFARQWLAHQLGRTGG
jgi:N-acetylglucosaminyldiphosphoundecaprenol N-acetyl-beta-D-mannosaminyltransferase